MNPGQKGAAKEHKEHKEEINPFMPSCLRVSLSGFASTTAPFASTRVSQRFVPPVPGPSIRMRAL
jgi:hypothetical protein